MDTLNAGLRIVNITDIGAENKLDVSELISLVAPFNEHTPSEI